MQREIRDRGPLLTREGRLREAGYSLAQLLEYDRRAIRAAPWRVKEWDFYQVSDRRICMQLTIGHASYVGQVAFALFELDGGARYAKSITVPLPFSRMGMPSDSSASLAYESGASRVEFRVQGGVRSLSCRMDGLDAMIELDDSPRDSMVIATPFGEGKGYFYYTATPR